MGKTSKRLLSLAIALVMVLSMVPAGGLKALAADQPLSTDVQAEITKGQNVKAAAKALEDGAFKNATGPVEAVCPVCGGAATSWTPLTQAGTDAHTLTGGGHYYIQEGLELSGDIDLVGASAADKACVLLNGKTITSTTRAFYVQLGTLNIMGSGTASGASDSFGHAVQNFRGVLNLYGGNYTSSSSSSHTAIVGTHSNGGTINIYDGTTITGTANTSYTVFLGNSVSQASYLNIYGGTIDGSNATDAINLQGHATNTARPANALFANGTIKGRVYLGSGARIAKFEMVGGTIESKEGGYAIDSLGNTTEHTISISGGTVKGLLCGKDKVSSFSVTGGTFSLDPSVYVASGYEATQNGTTWTVAASAQGYQAKCEACGETKTWTKVTSTTTALEDGGHYYVSGEVTVDATIGFNVTDGTVCVLLEEGCNITCSQNVAVFTATSGLMNFMGKGTITTTQAGLNTAPVFISSSNGKVNIYSGNYNGAQTNRGSVSIYGGAGKLTVKGGHFTMPIMARGAATVEIQGGTFDRNAFNSYNTAGAVTATISGGTFGGTVLHDGLKSFAGTITGGTFSYDPTSYGVAEGYRVNDNGDGTYTVVESSCAKDGHDWQDATCYTPKTCKVCGEVEGTALGHDFQGTEEGAKCSRCDVVRDAKHPATMGDTLHCDKCDQDVAIGSWTAITAAAELGNGHYYLANNIEGQITVAEGATACLHLNGYDVSHATQAILVSKANSVLSVMGDGNVTATAAGNGVNNGAAVINGVTGATGHQLYIYGGTYTTSQVNRGALVAGDNSTLKIYGGTVNGPVMVKETVVDLTINGGDFRSSYGIFNGWKLTDGVAKTQIVINGGTFHNELFVAPEETDANQAHFNPSSLAYNAIRGGTFLVNPCDYTDGLCADILDNCYYKVKNAEHENWAQVGETETWVCTDCGWIDGEEIAGMTAVISPNGSEYFASVEDAVDAYNGTGYIKLFSDATIPVSGKASIDANGHAVTITGSGKVSLMDSANDSYVNYGSFTVAEGIEIVRDVVNPVNGNRYITIDDADSNYNLFYTAHRVDIKLTNVTLRPSAAGMYYKSEYKCDDKLADRISAYGVVISAVDVPGADFTEVSNDGFSVLTEGFTPDANHAVKATSGALFGLMKSSYSAAVNKARAESTIYANAYFTVNYKDSADPSDDLIVMGDITNQGTTNGVGFSLLSILKYIDSHWTAYADYQQSVKDFYATWKATGINWDAEFTNIDA